MHLKCNYALLLISGILLHHIKGLSSASPPSMRKNCGTISEYENNENDCIEDSYQCADGKFIESSSVCDGIADCADKVDDEQECQRCPEGSYKCDSGSCINETLICDGKKDCPKHGDDEEDCETVNGCAKTKAKCGCTGDSIVCSGEGLISIPKKINKNITTFDFKNNKLGLVENFSNLAFSRYNQLRNLYLDHNNIIRLPSTIFENLKALISLGLSNNKIESLDKDVFKNQRELVYLDLAFNHIKKLPAEVFSNLNKLIDLSLNSNEISEIEDFTFNNLTELRTLNLGSNRIRKLTANLFKEMKNLTKLFLRSNKISVIENLTFNNNVGLLDIDLGLNRISTLTSYLFHNMTGLQSLRLMKNKISIIEDYAFSGLPKLKNLYLNSNRIKKLPSDMFPKTSGLEKLFLQDNEITSIESSTFNKLENLIILDLSFNRISSLDSYVFQGLYNLGTLYLQNNSIATLERSSFHGLRNLTFLNLQHNQIQDVDGDLFQDVSSLNHLITDENRFCCMKKDLSTCIPSSNEFSYCDDLMANTFLRISIWVLAITAISANSFVLILRSGEPDSPMGQKNSFLIKNLAVSDLFMGIYLLIIAFADFFYRGEYYLHNFEWRTSLLCNFAGFMSTFSSELTVFTLTVIAIDRSITLTFPLRRLLSSEKFNGTRILMSIVWLLAAILSLAPLPLFNIDYFENFYGRSGVCLPLHIMNEKADGWQYAVFIFMILNGISFTAITLSYIYMYWLSKPIKKTARWPNYSWYNSIGFRMTLLVLADAACCIPIITLGIKSLMGYPITPNMYAWIAVFVLPLNAALNPILYTISTQPFEIYLQMKKKLLNSQLGLRWPCYVKKADNSNTIPLEVRKTVSPTS